MTLKKICTCGVRLTTRNIKNLGRNTWGDVSVLWFDCLSCHSSGCFKTKAKVPEQIKEAA
jgi:hypothetical protein